MRGAPLALALATSLGLAGSGCAGGGAVLRVVDGRVVQGEVVEPEAYAAFLRGAIAEDRGELDEALAAYDEAARRDHDDPEVWTRVGDVRCRKNAHDPKADAAIDRALAIDRRYAAAWSARARCASRRGDEETARAASRRAADADPLDVDTELAATRADDGSEPERVRTRLVALTMLHGERSAAWDALATWGHVHRDAPLVARALAHLVVLSPQRRGAIASDACRLAGEGERDAARLVSGAVTDAGWIGERTSACFLTMARLALDDAIAAGDADRVRSRATHLHVPLDVAGARALLAGDAALARELLRPLVDADRGATGAALMLAVAASDGGDVPSRERILAAASASREPLPSDVALVFAKMLVREVGRDAARGFLAHAPRAPLLAGDAATTTLAVELAARGALDEAELTADARIELAARLGVPPAVTALGGADARHRLLALSLLRPAERLTIELARYLAPAAPRDSLLAVATARIALGGGAIPLPRADALAAFDPTDPLVAAAALDLAVREANARAIPKARARLNAVARTPAERARVE